MIIGIVGSESAKFTPKTEKQAKELIRGILTRPDVTGVSSGHCHLGGIDIWAEEIGKELGLDLYIFAPINRSWSAKGGFMERNIQIAEKSDEVHCITLKELPDSYTGMRFKLCYHCDTDTHIKSGGCWTMHYAMKIGKFGVLHVI